jgi:hypothetical protein
VQLLFSLFSFGLTRMIPLVNLTNVQSSLSLIPVGFHLKKVQAGAFGGSLGTLIDLRLVGRHNER